MDNLCAVCGSVVDIPNTTEREPFQQNDMPKSDQD